MRVVGLITEYNPFHNGHLHHLRESLRVAEADASVAVMSGHFLQRGEPALLDKWRRTEMALAAGVDLVLELPFPFACNSAPHFATGAVRTLNALGVVDALCFGSEAGELEPLQELAGLLIARADEIARETAARLRQGVNYPVARSEIIARLAPALAAETIALPNNILGIEYLRALRETASPVRPVTIPRLGSGYHSTGISGGIASATGIRKRLDEGNGVDRLVPESCYPLLQQALDEGHGLDYDRLFVALQALLLQQAGTLTGIYQASDGVMQRLTAAAMTADSYADLAALVKSRQWTLTRVQRLLSYVLLQVKQSEMTAFLEQGPGYLRLLGATAKGRQLLAAMRSKQSLPIIADPARANATLRRFYRHQKQSGVLAEKMFACDLRATRLFSLLQKIFPGQHKNRDFFEKVRFYEGSFLQ